MFDFIKKTVIVFIIAFAAYCYVTSTKPTDAARDINNTTKSIEKNVKQTTKSVDRNVKKVKNEYNGVKAGYKICSDRFGTSHPLDFIDCMVGGST